MRGAGKCPPPCKNNDTDKAFDIGQDVIITCLPNSDVAKRVFNLINSSPHSATHKGRFIIDCSTIDLTTSRYIANLLASTDSGVYIDAPMSGGVVGARAKTLTFMVGGSATVFEQVKPVLQMMGERIIHCGKQGNGLSAKLSNNYLLAISNIATAEAMNLGVKSGLEPEVLAQIINSGTGRCWASEVNNPVPGVVKSAPASRKYAGGFSISLMNKDLRLATAAAGEVGAQLLLSGQASKAYSVLENDEVYRAKDFSVIYELLNSGWLDAGRETPKL
jgi:3-hydroxyisobutyrate dehydrogenase